MTSFACRNRVMVASDLDAVSLLDGECYPGRHWCIETLERHYHGKARCAVAVATLHSPRPDGLIGYVLHTLDRRGRLTRLLRLGVASECRRLGVGGKLLDRVLTYALKHDYPAALALEAVLEDDLLPGAHAFLRSQGYRLVPGRSGHGTGLTTFGINLHQESCASFPGVD